MSHRDATHQRVTQLVGGGKGDLSRCYTYMSEPVKSVKYCYCQIKLSPCYFKLVFPQLPDFYLSRLIDIQDKEQRYSRLFEKFGI